jgi:hypothetical protein
MDDLRRSGENIRQPGNGCLEVAGGDVGLVGCRVAESLDQEIHRRVVSAPRPLEADIAPGSARVAAVSTTNPPNPLCSLSDGTMESRITASQATHPFAYLIWLVTTHGYMDSSRVDVPGELIMRCPGSALLRATRQRHQAACAKRPLPTGIPVQAACTFTRLSSRRGEMALCR